MPKKWWAVTLALAVLLAPQAGAKAADPKADPKNLGAPPKTPGVPPKKGGKKADPKPPPKAGPKKATAEEVQAALAAMQGEDPVKPDEEEDEEEEGTDSGDTA